MKTGLFVGFLFIFGLIYCNSGQAPPTQNGTDLTTFLNEYFSARRTTGRTRKSPTPTTPSSADAPRSVDLPLSITIDVHEDTAMEYDDLVDSIFHKNFSFNDPNAIVVSRYAFLSQLLFVDYKLILLLFKCPLAAVHQW